MDAPGAYVGGGHVQHLSRREIEKMKKNMKKVPVIQLKTEIYHNQELHEAENILHKIDETEVEQTHSTETTQEHLPWYKKLLHKLQTYFNSST